MFNFRIQRSGDGKWWMVCSTAAAHQVWSGYVCKRHWPVT